MKSNQLKIYIFCCTSSFDIKDIERRFHNESDIQFKVIGLPCSGKVDLLYLIKSFETGADGALLLTCKEGECRYMEGNLRARKRADAVNEILGEIGTGASLKVISKSGEDSKELFQAIDAFCALIRNQSMQGVKSHTAAQSAAVI